MKNRADFSSRIGVRAVTAGVMASISIMIILMAMIAALGIWNFNLVELITAGPLFWLSATVAWAMSLFTAGFIAALGSRSQTNIEGTLNALAACCGSFLLFGMLFLLFAPNILEALLSQGNPQFYLRMFLGDLAAFSLGLYGGVVGTHFEHRAHGEHRDHHGDHFKSGRKIFPHA